MPQFGQLLRSLLLLEQCYGMPVMVPTWVLAKRRKCMTHARACKTEHLAACTTFSNGKHQNVTLLPAVPTVERAPEEPPPFVVLVQGPPQVRPRSSSSAVALRVLSCVACAVERGALEHQMRPECSVVPRMLTACHVA